MKLTGDVLVVMAKYPRVGQVKTRLAAVLGAVTARDVYAAFLLDIRDRFSVEDWTLVWAVDPPGSRFASLVGGESLCIDQRGANLAERMYRCFETLFGAGASRVVMIGGDVPHLPIETVHAAFRGLNDCDATLVPTADGGYCLVGLRSVVDLFTPVEMGTSEVFARTRALVASRGLRLHTLEPCFDIDERADLERLAQWIRSGKIELPHTAAIIDTLVRP